MVGLELLEQEIPPPEPFPENDAEFPLMVLPLIVGLELL
jgi:hypothetical protein